MRYLGKKFLFLAAHFNYFPEHSKKDVGEYIKSFIDHGFDAYMIVNKLYDKNFQEIYNIKVYELNLHFNQDSLRRFLSVKELYKTFKIVRNIKPDIILTYVFTTSVFTIPLLKIFHRKTKIILKLDSDGTFLKIGPLYKRVLRVIILFIYGFLVDFIVVESSCGYEVFSKIPYFNKKLRIIPNSVSNSMISLNESKLRKPIILSVGRIDRIKAHEILIQAFAKIKDKYPRWNVEIIGLLDDENYYKELLNLIEKLKLNSRVSIIVNADDNTIRKKYAESSIFALFSKFEGFSIARLEALANGLYVIISEAGCGKDLETYGAVVVPINNVDKAAEALEKAIIMIENGEFDFKPKKIPTYNELVDKILSELKV